MKRLLPLILLLFLLAGLPMAGCKSIVQGSGELKSEAYNFKDFSSVRIDGPFSFHIAYSTSYSVGIMADDNLFEKIEVAKDGDTLVIAFGGADFLGMKMLEFAETTAVAQITLPQLRSLSLNGAAKGDMTGFDTRAGIVLDMDGASILYIENISTGDAVLNVAGASYAAGKITAGDIDFDISGASTAWFDGSASNMACDVSGASELKLDNFSLDNATVKLSGASNSTIRLTGKLNVNLSGASDLAYYGDPVMGDTSISGGSTMSRK